MRDYWQLGRTSDNQNQKRDANEDACQYHREDDED
jgi:hypothetical protein